MKTREEDLAEEEEEERKKEEYREQQKTVSPPPHRFLEKNDTTSGKESARIQNGLSRTNERLRKVFPKS